LWARKTSSLSQQILSSAANPCYRSFTENSDNFKYATGDWKKAPHICRMLQANKTNKLEYITQVNQPEKNKECNEMTANNIQSHINIR
jgi:hypothetical protein